jgi:hypothetical protein
LTLCKDFDLVGSLAALVANTGLKISATHPTLYTEFRFFLDSLRKVVHSIFRQNASMTVENYLLAAMPRELYDKLAPNLKRVSLQLGDMLHHPGDTIEDLYFPIDCALSITITMNDGRTAETG